MGDEWEMKITQKEVKKLFNYNNITGGLYWNIKKALRTKIGNRAGNIRKDGYRRIKINNKNYYEHRLIWLYFKGIFPKRLDHINQNKSDNRIENLRESTRSQNHMNRKKQRTYQNQPCSSKYKGVNYQKTSKKWVAYIQINKKGIRLGSFNTEKEAGLAYNKKAIELFGEFACLNIIEG